MPEYTKEQIDEAKEWFSSFTKQKHHGLHEKYGAILLSALDTAEREREQATELAKQLAEKVAGAEGRAKRKAASRRRGLARVGGLCAKDGAEINARYRKSRGVGCVL